MANVKKQYTKEEFINAVTTSTSIRQVLIKLGLVAKGGNYGTVQRLISKYNLSISHFTGQAWSRDRKIGYKVPIEKYLNNELPISSHDLKLRLIREGYLIAECNKCCLTNWLDRPISFELNHIDGNHSNNILSNIELLCPNCHSQTPHWRKSKTTYKKYNECKNCKIQININRVFCKDCFISREYLFFKRKQTRIKKEKIKITQIKIRKKISQSTKIKWPSTNELKAMLANSNYTVLGKKLGVSDNAIRKRLKNHP